MLLNVTQTVNYMSHNVTQNGVVKLNFKANFDQITSSMELLQMLETNISIKAKSPLSDNISVLGTFKITGINFNASGVSTLKFASIDNAVDFDALNDLITPQVIRVKYSAHVESEEDKEE